MEKSFGINIMETSRCTYPFWLSVYWWKLL